MLLSPFSDLVGVRLLSAAGGKSELELAVSDRSCNRSGTVHGGAIFTLADAAMGAAVKSLGSGDSGVFTRSASIEYLHAAKGSTLVCRAEVLERDGRNCNVRARIYAGGTLVAEAVSSYVLVGS